MNEQQSLTFGQKAVGLNFNPSGDDAVAITELQAAQMWAVKALTWKD